MRARWCAIGSESRWSCRSFASMLELLESTEHASLLGAVRARPDEDAPRLGYARWLDSHADPVLTARAELIRAQLAIANGADDAALHARELELLARYGAT